MSNVYKGTLGLIGNTPLVEIANVERDSVSRRLSWSNSNTSIPPGASKIVSPKR